MRRFRIVEGRTAKKINGRYQLTPVFYIEEGTKILFWTFWNRYEYDIYSSKEEARNTVDIIKYIHEFKKIKTTL